MNESIKTTAAKLLPRVNANWYRFTHRHSPRGFGRWAFSPNRNARLEEAFITPAMNYSEAARLARRHFAGQSEIFPLT